MPRRVVSERFTCRGARQHSDDVTKSTLIQINPDKGIFRWRKKTNGRVWPQRRRAKLATIRSGGQPGRNAQCRGTQETVETAISRQRLPPGGVSVTSSARVPLQVV